MDARDDATNRTPRHPRHPHRTGRLMRALAMTTLVALAAVVGLTSIGLVPTGSHWAAGLRVISKQVVDPADSPTGSHWAGGLFGTTARGSSWS
jgi:hypothetical protein